MAAPRPPRFARWLVERALPADVRDDIAGDLEEVFHRDCAARGTVRARLHYWQAAASFSRHFVAERLRQSPRRSRPIAARPWPEPGRTGQRRIGMSWLDFKLGFRMLVRYPGLTLVGGLAMAFAIALGASMFGFAIQVVRPTLPLEDAERLVGIRLWESASSRVESRTAHDFAAWRGSVGSVESLGAFRTVSRNFITPAGHSAVVQIAEVTASALRLARVAPRLGRSLIEADEQIGAPPVVVVGFAVWQAQLGGDASAIGQTVRLGRSIATVVGVMPDGFEFPVAHDAWTPLQLTRADHARRQGPELRILGRLAPGATLGEAQAELTTIGARAAAAFPDTHAHLQPQVMPYPQLIVDVSVWESVGILSINLLLVLLLVLICGNIALLMFARAATREREIVVRSALGASRGRIVMQLFTEALVLGGVAAVVGLAAAREALAWGLRMIEGQSGRLPFWVVDDLAPVTVLYAAVLTLIGAVVAGVMPALKVTRGLESQLRQGHTGQGLRFGGVWTAIIVTQVAVTVAAPVTTFFVRRDELQIRSVDVAFPAEQYLSLRLEMDSELPSGALTEDSSRTEFLTRFDTTYRELERRIAAEPGVAGVTLADRLPRMYHPHRLVEIDQGDAAPLDPRWPGYRVSSATVEANYFDVFSTPILAGRGFHSGDLESDRPVVIVNQSFVDRVLGQRNPIGRRVRYTYFEEWDEPRSPDAPPGPWHEIVGVVSDMGMAVAPDPKVAGLYHPLEPRSVYQIQMAVQTRGEPEAFAPRLRALAAAVDPALRVQGVVRLDQVATADLQFLAFWFRLTVLMSGVAMVLSLAGIYAVMSFTVSRSTREIGIRVALGARRRGVVLAILQRPIAHVGIGVVAGAALSAVLAYSVLRGDVWPTGAALLVGYAALMFGVCLLACIVPTRRALRVQPIEALKEGG